MTKYVLLESVVPTTFDAGFRPHGYQIVGKIIETDGPVPLPKDALENLLDEHRRKSRKIKA